MRVFILNPPVLSGQGFVREGRCEQRLTSYQYVLLPVSLPSIAAVLRRENIEVKIHDGVAERTPVARIKRDLKRFQPDIIILNVSTVTFENDMRIAEVIRKSFPRVKIGTIGVHVTSLPDEALTYPAINFVIRGEPEETARELVLALRHKKPLSGIKGISYRSGPKIYHNDDRPFITNLDALPFPARDLVKNDLYLMSMSNKPHTVILTSRGCPNNCIFCTAHKYYGRTFRTRSAQNVAEEMEEIEKKYKIFYATMWADTFTLDPKFVFELCAEIKKRGLKMKWMCNSRVNTISADMLKAMKSAGCTGIAYGVESGNQEILNNIRKGTNLELIEKAFKLTRRAGIDSLAHVIFGLPGETKNTIRNTIAFIKHINPSYAQFYCAVPFPGTEFARLSEKEGWTTTHDWNRYEINQAIIATKTLSAKELERARRRAYIAFYFRPAYLLKTGWKHSKRGEFTHVLRQAFGFFADWVGVKK